MASHPLAGSGPPFFHIAGRAIAAATITGMLPSPYAWRLEVDRAFLDYRYGNVANVQYIRGEWRLTIRYQTAHVDASCASLDQGVRYVDRWIAARGAGIPGLGQRSRWYDRRPPR